MQTLKQPIVLSQRFQSSVVQFKATEFFNNGRLISCSHTQRQHERQYVRRFYPGIEINRLMNLCAPVLRVYPARKTQ